MGHYHITMATVSGRRLLTAEGADKTTLELQLSWGKEKGEEVRKHVRKMPPVCQSVCQTTCMLISPRL